jgi:hypothetical protein
MIHRLRGGLKMLGTPIDRELTHHQYLRARLEEEFPDADEETLVDTLEGLSNLPDMLAEVCRSMLGEVWTD